MKPAKHKVAALLRQLPRCKVFQILGARDSSLKVSPLVTQIHPVAKSLNTVERIEMNDHPHPGPLPQERVNRSPSLCVARASRSSFAFRFDESRRGDRPFDSRKICNGQTLFHLPGGEGQGEGERHNQFQKLWN